MLPSKLLPEQLLNIRLIINDGIERVHAPSPDLVTGAPARGNTILEFRECTGLGINVDCCRHAVSQ